MTDSKKKISVIHKLNNVLNILGLGVNFENEPKKSSNKEKILTGIFILFIILFAWFQSSKNNIVTITQATESAWNHLETQELNYMEIGKRFITLIPESYKKNINTSIQEKISTSKSRYLNESSLKEKIVIAFEFNAMLKAVLSPLSVSPKFKKETSAFEIYSTLETIQTRLALEIDNYNANAYLLNSEKHSFSSKLIIKVVKFTHFPLFPTEYLIASPPTS